MGEKESVVPKGLTFQACDESLVCAILEYQKQQGLPSFIAAVRELCNKALQF